VESC